MNNMTTVKLFDHVDSFEPDNSSKKTNFTDIAFLIVSLIGIGLLCTPQIMRCYGIILTIFIFLTFGIMSQISSLQISTIYQYNKISDWGNVCKLIQGKRLSVVLRLLYVINGTFQAAIQLNLISNPILWIFKIQGKQEVFDKYIQTRMKTKTFWICLVWLCGFLFQFKRTMRNFKSITWINLVLLLSVLVSFLVLNQCMDDNEINLQHFKSHVINDQSIFYETMLQPKVNFKKLTESLPSLFYLFSFQFSQQDLTKTRTEVSRQMKIIKTAIAISVFLMVVIGIWGQFLFKDDVMQVLMTNIKDDKFMVMVDNSWEIGLLSFIIQCVQSALGILCWPFWYFSSRDNCTNIVNSVMHRIRLNRRIQNPDQVGHKERILINEINSRSNQSIEDKISNENSNENQNVNSISNENSATKITKTEKRVSTSGVSNQLPNEDLYSERNIQTSLKIMPLHVNKKDFSSKPWIFTLISLFMSFVPVIICWFFEKIEQMIALVGTIVSTNIIFTIPSIICIQGYRKYEKEENWLQQYSFFSLTFGLIMTILCTFICWSKLTGWR